jgi:hypothetical protein
MNERIKLLSEQAIEYADYYAMLSDGKEQEIFTEKFAELIVRECVGVNYKSPFRDGEFHAREVLEHFGIEE